MNGGIELGDDIVSKPPTPIVRDADALFLRGIDALERNRFEEAAKSLQLAVSLAPKSSAVHLALGIACTHLLDIPAAFEALETAIELDPEGFFPHLRLGELYLRIGVPTKAQEELQLALDLSTSAEQRKMVRELLAVEKKRAAKRIWRPDFNRLLRRKRKS